jgi:hypothetical protein
MSRRSLAILAALAMSLVPATNPSSFWRYADIYRQSPASHDYFDFNGNGSPVYGNMLYAPGCAWASGTIQYSGGWSTGTAVQPGC